MKNAGVFLLLAACAGTGCVTFPTLWGQPKPEPVPTKATAPAPAKPARPITADQINDLNAHEKAAQLLQELEGDTPNGDAKTTPGGRTK